MSEMQQRRDAAYLRLLHFGLVLLRNYSHGGRVELWRIESDHLHEIPTLIGETNERRHLYYIEKQRDLFLERLRELNATEYLEQVSIWYTEPWNILAYIAGVSLETGGVDNGHSGQG